MVVLEQASVAGLAFAQGAPRAQPLQFGRGATGQDAHERRALARGWAHGQVVEHRQHAQGVAPCVAQPEAHVRAYAQRNVQLGFRKGVLHSVGEYAQVRCIEGLRAGRAAQRVVEGFGGRVAQPRGQHAQVVPVVAQLAHQGVARPQPPRQLLHQHLEELFLHQRRGNLHDAAQGAFGPAQGAAGLVQAQGQPQQQGGGGDEQRGVVGDVAPPRGGGGRGWLGGGVVRCLRGGLHCDRGCCRGHGLGVRNGGDGGSPTHAPQGGGRGRRGRPAQGDRHRKGDEPDDSGCGPEMMHAGHGGSPCAGGAPRRARRKVVRVGEYTRNRVWSDMKIAVMWGVGVVLGDGSGRAGVQSDPSRHPPRTR